MHRFSSAAFLAFSLAMILIVTFAGCGRTIPQNAEGAAVSQSGASVKEDPKATADEKPDAVADADNSASGSKRIRALLKAFEDAGIEASLNEIHDSNIIKSLYGCTAQYDLLLDDHLVIVLEFNLDDLDATGERYISFIDENGYDRKSNQPAWHHKEFVMVGKASVIENGTVTKEFFVEEHPKYELIMDVFTSV